VTNQEQKFLATLHFSDLILYEPEQTIQQIVEDLKPHHPLSVHPTTSIDEVIRLFDEMLSLAIGIAMFINLLLAGSVGALIPLLFKKIGIDPTIASSIILTTTTDIFGFFMFLFLAEKILM